MSAKTDLLTRRALRPGFWSAAVAAQAARIPHDEPCDFVDLLRRKIESGAAHLAHAVNAAGVVGFVVYSVTDYGAAREMVVLAAFGRDQGHDLTAEFSPEINALAASLKCASWRFHTIRPALVEKAVALGGRVSEVIVRFSVK